MAAAVHAKDWSLTPLGPIDGWPQALRTAVGICLHSPFPMFVWWGPELINIYNDAYAPVLGKRHPAALGMPARQVWADIWPDIAQDVDRVIRRGEAVSKERVRFVMERNGYPEETFFTYSHSPIPDGHGGIGGLFQVCTDETARVRTEAALAEARRRLDSALIAGEVGTFEWDVVRDRLWGDRNFGRIFSIALDETGAAPLADYAATIHPDDRGRVIELVRRTLETGCDYEAAYRIVIGGRTRWVVARGKVERDEMGRVVRFPGVVVEVTGRKQAEEAMRQSEERFRASFEQAAVGIAHVGLDGQWLRVNQKLCEIVGYAREEVLGLRFQDITHPDDLRRDLENLRRLLAGEIHTYTTEKRYVRKDQRVVWANLTVSLVRSVAEPDSAYFVSVVEDVSQRKQAEAAVRDTAERLRFALDAGKLGDWTWEAATDLVALSPRAAEIFDVPAGRQITWASMREMLHPDDCERARVAVERALVECGDYDTEYRLNRTDGTQVWVSAKGRGTYDAGGRTVGMTGVVQDVTARKRAEARDQFLILLDDAMRPLIDPQQITAAGARLLAEYLAADRCAYADVEADEDTFNLTGDYNRGVPSIVGRYRFADFGLEVLRLMRADEPYVVEDIDTHQPLVGDLTYYRRTMIRAVICVPLHKAGRFVAAMAVHQKVPRAWSADEVDLVRHVAGRCWESIERARVERDLRLSEGRLRAVLEANPECVKVVSPEGNLDYMNPAGLYMIESDELPPVRGACVFDLVVAEQRDQWRAYHERVCRGERLTWQFEIIGLRGTRRWMETHAVPLPLPDGRTAQLAVTREVTERKRIEREREHLLEREREARAEAETLVRVGRSLSAELDLHRLVQTATDAATDLAGAAFGAFFYNVPDPKGGHYTLYTIAGVPREEFSKFPMPRATDLFGPTFRGEGVVRLDDVTADSRYGRNVPYRGMPEGHLPVRSYLAVPVRSRSGEVLGGLFLGHSEAGRFTERHERLVGGIAAHAAVAIDNARLFEAARASSEVSERSLAQLRAVVGSMAEGLVLADPQGNLSEWNPAALEMHGYGSVAEVHRHLNNFPAILELFTEDGVVIPFEHWPMHRVLRGETFFGYEVTIRRLDADFRRVISYSGSPVRNRDGEVVLGVLTLHDVTEERRAQAALRESEAQFRQLAETIPQLAWMAKPDGWITWYNRRWYDYTGTTPEQMEGWGWQRVHHPTELPRVMEGWQHSIRTGEPFEMEFPLKGADGQFRWFLTRVAPLRDGEGNIALWFGTNTDIEDRRRVAEERSRLLASEREARANAERQGRLKDEFLATLSHELRTPLNAILGWSQVLRHGGGRDERDLAEGLETIERNARAQAKIVEDLLEMSRIISGKVRLDVQRLNLPSVVEAAVETVRHAADAKGVRLSVVLDPLAGPVSGDPNRLQQVVWNLLSNAIKFTPRGGRVQVLLERVNSHLEVSVIDTGEGIRPEFLPHVFDRFKQADASTTRRHGGLGLGLSIVKQLVELHGGTVRAKSPGAGMGSTFTVSLPLTPIHSGEEQEQDRRHPRAEAEPPPAGLDDCPKLKGVRVLVVDDEADSRALVKRLLEDCEATVLTAGSAAEALESVRRERPDVVISDIGMPGEDGYTLMRKVRALAPENGGSVPAVALTAYARSEDRRRAILAGYQMHVAKPVEPAELITMVASLAGRAG